MTEHTQIKAVIFGCRGTSLSPEERAFFKKHTPLGFIIFDRNVQNPEQLKALIADFRALVGRPNAPVLVDQEGGRVTRLWPPFWTGLGWNRTYGDFYKEDAEKGINGVREHARILAKDLLSVGIDVDCWPCLDVANEQTHEIMAKRCFSDNPEIVTALGQAGIETALQKGLMPIIKHIPGYGRTLVDPHMGLPVVKEDLKTLEGSDFIPFKAVNLPVWGMTAHVIYTALDDKKPATLSKKTLDYIRTKIGFNGFLVCDDISMGALREFGSLADLTREMIAAGCDAVLHCNGNMDEMQQIADAVSYMSETSLNRLATAENLRHG